MNRISKFAAALALGAFVAVPAAYAQKDDKKKKEEAAKPVKRNFSKEFQKAYAPAADALVKKKDLVAAQAAFPAVEAAIMTPDDRYEAGIFALNLGGQLIGIQRKQLFFESFYRQVHFDVLHIRNRTVVAGKNKQ